jgi:hypothetical protein
MQSTNDEKARERAHEQPHSHAHAHVWCAAGGGGRSELIRSAGARVHINIYLAHEGGVFFRQSVQLLLQMFLFPLRL